MDRDIERFYEFLNRRRSVREFMDREIEEEKLSRFLDVLRNAQGAANRQPRHFIVVKGEKREGFNRVFTKEGFKNAPLCIVACAEPDKAWVRKADRTNYAWVDTTIAITEMIAASSAEGIGTCWVAAIDPAQVKTILDIPENIEVVAVIAMGYPKEPLVVQEKARKPLEEIIHHERW
ncbi:MAG: nitroreductase family protein [Deltaproteobacteria bacterium]|nr:nitroreductase family protein [Deltaproteobacteria bacterium]